MPSVASTSTPRLDAREAAAPRPAASRKPDRHTAALERLLRSCDVSCEVELPSGVCIRSGAEPPAFRVKVHSDRALRRLDEYALGRAYVDGQIDLEGDMLALLELRDAMRDRFPLALTLQFLWRLVLARSTWINRTSIAEHYSYGDDFYLSFTDRDYHFYSHCVFDNDEETLEQAAGHKLEQMFDALQLKPGMRLLDIGGGWGAAIKYCAPRGVHVTSLTVAEDSYRYITKYLQESGLAGAVRFEDFLTHAPDEPYDAVVIYGVIEHIPMYRRFAEQVWRCLKPGGRLYVDASATKQKFEMSAFTRRYTWHGTHTFLCLQDLMQEVLYAGMDIVRVREETHDYELTMRHWAERFDAQREMIVSRWGERLYRHHRIFLWGGCHAFRRGRLQAYHLVARRGPDPGPRPGVVTRTSQFFKGLF
jgi:cyclopropane fatty-acyl-phospholipid synthase-like methyltransferase